MRLYVEAHYEKILLASLLILLSITSIIAILMVRSFSPVIIDGGQSVQVDDLPKSQFASINLNLLENDNSLEQFVYCRNSECNYLINKSLHKCNWCGTALMKVVEYDNDLNRNRIEDKLELSWGLNLDDPNELLRDKDGDGFSNIDEYDTDNSPVDSKSHPPIILRATFKGIENKPVPFTLKDVIEAQDVRGNKRIYVDAEHDKRGSFYLAVGEETSWMKVLDAGVENGKKYAVIQYFTFQFKIQIGKVLQYPGWPKYIICNELNDGKLHKVEMGGDLVLLSKAGEKENYKLKRCNLSKNELTVVSSQLTEEFKVGEVSRLKEPLK